MREHMDTATLRELEASYAGVSLTTLWRTCDLFSKVARELAAELGFAYPEEQEAKVRRYLSTAESGISSRSP